MSYKYHVLCGWFNGQYTRMNINKNNTNNNNLICNSYCIKHTPLSVGGINRNFNRFKYLRKLDKLEVEC